MHNLEIVLIYFLSPEGSRAKEPESLKRSLPKMLTSQITREALKTQLRESIADKCIGKKENYNSIYNPAYCNNTHKITHTTGYSKPHKHHFDRSRKRACWRQNTGCWRS